MRQRTWLILVGVLSMVVLAAAQARLQNPGAPRTTVHSEKVSTASGEVTMTNVEIEVNGITIHADRAVRKGGEYRLEGNVRLTVPEP